MTELRAPFGGEIRVSAGNTFISACRNSDLALVVVPVQTIAKELNPEQISYLALVILEPTDQNSSLRKTLQKFWPISVGGN